MFDRLQTLGERTTQLLSGNLRLIERSRFDQITDGFSLCEVNAPIQKRPHGELARLGEAGPVGEGQLDDVGKDDRRPMKRDFDDVIRRVGMRLSEIGDNDFIDAIRVWRGHSCPRTAGGGSNVWADLSSRLFADKSVRATGVHQLTEDGPSGFDFIFQTKHS